LLLFSVACLQSVEGQSPPQVILSLIKDRPSYEVYTVTFTIPVQNAEPPNGIVYVEYYKTKISGHLPGVVLLHHYGVRKPQIERRIASLLAEKGIATAMLIMPYHLQRTPHGFKSGKAMISSDIPRLVGSIQQTIQEVDALVQWLKSRPEIDQDKIGLVGISLGAIIGATAVGQLNEFDATVLVLGGGNVADILWKSPMTAAIRPSLRREGYTEEKLTQELVQIEPLEYAKTSMGRSLYMINATDDPIVPKKDTVALWNSLGQPQLTWIEAGHYMPGWGRTRADKLVCDYLLYRFGKIPSFIPPSNVKLRIVKIGLFVDKSPAVGIGGSVELLQVGDSPLAVDLNLTTGGVSVGAGLRAGKRMTFGLERKLFSDEKRLVPYAMVHFTL
jgi:dienelactone hydrolase